MAKGVVVSDKVVKFCACNFIFIISSLKMFCVCADHNLVTLFDFMQIVAKENVVEDFSLKMDSHHNM